MRQLNHLQQFGNFRFDPGGIWPFTLRQHRQAEGNVVEHRHMTKQRVVLKHKANFTVASVHPADVGTVKTNVPAGLILQPGNDAQQRGFPGA